MVGKYFLNNSVSGSISSAVYTLGSFLTFSLVRMFSQDRRLAMIPKDVKVDKGNKSLVSSKALAFNALFTAGFSKSFRVNI